MKTALKIISFPVRFILFLLLAIISGITFTCNHTIGYFCVFASGVIQALGVGACIFGLGSIIAAYVRGYETISQQAPIWAFAILVVFGLVVMTMFFFLPVISRTLYNWFDIVAVRIMEIAKLILLCRR